MRSGQADFSFNCSTMEHSHTGSSDGEIDLEFFFKKSCSSVLNSALPISTKNEAAGAVGVLSSSITHSWCRAGCLGRARGGPAGSRAPKLFLRRGGSACPPPRLPPFPPPFLLGTRISSELQKDFFLLRAAVDMYYLLEYMPSGLRIPTLRAIFEL